MFKSIICFFIILLSFPLILPCCGHINFNSDFKNYTNLPKKLLVYYGWPNEINNAHQEADPIATASAEFSKYDYVVLGHGLEKATHSAHDATARIIAHENAANTFFFGYIDLGIFTHNHSMAEIKTRVDEWIATGIDGIFFDDFGYDFLVSRARQNEAVSYVHSKGIPVIANAWDPDHVFSSEYDPYYNRDCTATVLNSSDFYFYESYQISKGKHETKEHRQSKLIKLKVYQNTLKFKILAVTTNNRQNLYCENNFYYAWYSALIDEFEAIGWGEYNFSINGKAQFRIRPDADCQSYLTRNKSLGLVL